jgi:hypothetical protein
MLEKHLLSNTVYLKTHLKLENERDVIAIPVIDH